MAQLTNGANEPQFSQVVLLSPSLVSANSVSKETVTVTGVRTDVLYVGDAPTLDAGLFFLGFRPTAANTLEVTLFNPTNADITPTASQPFRIIGL